ncbi:MAG: hypothetical protein F7C07_01145 [Desulfurococcales archaeon]|nr:hypothetical protein [Desulfurococcales archaeon]
MVDGGSLEWLQPLLLIVMLMAIIALTLRQASELRRMQEQASKKTKTLTIINCGDSGRVERSFKEGDYVGKRVSECKNGEGLIEAIYTIEEKPAPKQGSAPQSQGSPQGAKSKWGLLKGLRRNYSKL